MRFLHIGMSTGDNGHAKGLRQAFPEYEEINVSDPNLNYLITNIAQQWSPELVFIQIQGPGISSEALRELKKYGAFIINWSGDVRSRIPDCYFEYAKNVDLTCFSNMNDVETLRSLGWPAEFLQIGYDPEIYTPLGSTVPVPEIVFMGNSFGHFPLSRLRQDMISELKRTYGSRFGAYGIGQPDGIFMGNQPGEAAVYRSAKIGINLSHFDYKRYTSDRMFRMLGSGVCVLSKSFPQWQNDFKHADELIIWNDIDDLKDKIDLILTDNATRNKIAKSGHQLVLNNHTFYHMGLSITKLYEQYK